MSTLTTDEPIAGMSSKLNAAPELKLLMHQYLAARLDKPIHVPAIHQMPLVKMCVITTNVSNSWRDSMTAVRILGELRPQSGV